MSAYQVPPHVTAYLLAAAERLELISRSDFRKIANELTAENMNSLVHRYSDPSELIHHRSVPESLLRAQWADEDFSIAQIRKSATCYEYQACEHPGYQESKAAKFICYLMDECSRREPLDKYPAPDECVWGAPEPIAESSDQG